jgi:predicted metal-dependent HD superfamily phosphohydrolase
MSEAPAGINIRALKDSASSLFRRLGVVERLSAPLVDGLIAAYQEPQRHYHTLQHIQECLSLLPLVINDCVHPDEVALAIWYHDVIYDPKAHDNEERSAARVLSDLMPLKGNSVVVDRISQLVLATKKHVASNADERVLMDIDLAVLGAGPARFAQYDAQIRSEYAHVPYWTYVRARRKVLSGFMQKQLFQCEIFQSRNAQAMLNLRRATAFPHWLRA